MHLYPRPVRPGLTVPMDEEAGPLLRGRLVIATCLAGQEMLPKESGGQGSAELERWKVGGAEAGIPLGHRVSFGQQEALGRPCEPAASKTSNFKAFGLLEMHSTIL